MRDALTRPFGLWTAMALVVGGMIGTGIFMLPASIAPFGWTALLGWAISIGGVLCIAYALGKLAASIPEKSGALAVTGAVLGPLWGAMIGWSYWISCVSGCAMLAIGATSYLSVAIPAVAGSRLEGALVAVAILWGVTILNLAGAKSAGRFQVVTTLLKLIPLATVMAMLAVLTLSRTIRAPPLPSGPAALAALPGVVALTLFPLVGFEAAGVASERVRDPARNVMRATMAGTALVGMIYVIVSVGIVFALPTAVVVASDATIALFVETFLGRGPALLLAAFAVISAIGALNCWALLQGEVPLAMARAGLLPRWFGTVSRRDVAVRPLLLATLLSSALVLSNASKSLVGIFTFVALLTTCTSLWLYFAVCLAALVRRVATPAAALGLPFIVWAMWGVGLEVSGLGLALTLTALPLYLLRGRAPVRDVRPIAAAR